MKRQDINALREKSTAELVAELAKLRAELTKARHEHKVNKLTNSALLLQHKKQIARISTILREKELSQ